MNSLQNGQRETETGKSEDDLFRVLARPDIEKMVTLHAEWVQSHRDFTGTYNQTKNIEFARYYGWTWTEFLKAKKEAGYFF